MNPKVSIIIPVYNVEEYIEECIISAINQTLKEIEIIIINDGSTDKSINIIKKYAKDSRINVINKVNEGQSVARNIGINIAKGKYIYFLDSDDYIGLNSMEECYKIAIKNNLDILVFDAQSFDHKSYHGNYKDNEYNRSNCLDSKIYEGEKFLDYLIKNNSYRVSVCIHFYKREFLKRHNLKFYEYVFHEDELFTSKATILAERIMYIPNKFFHRRIRNNSTMTSILNKKRIESLNIVADEIYGFITEYSNISNNDTKINILNQVKWLYLQGLLRTYELDADKKLKLELRRSFRKSIKKRKDIYSIELLLLSYIYKLYYLYNAINYKLINNLD